MTTIAAFIAGTVFGALLCDWMWKRSWQIMHRASRVKRVDWRG